MAASAETDVEMERPDDGVYHAATDVSDSGDDDSTEPGADDKLYAAVAARSSRIKWTNDTFVKPYLSTAVTAIRLS